MIDGLLGAGASSSLFGNAVVKGEGQAVGYGSSLAAQNAMDQQAYNEMLRNQMLMRQEMLANAQAKVKPFNPNEEAAYKIKLSELVTLWQARYGDTWAERFDEPFWAEARVRLHENDKLEAVSGWYRLKEDA